MTLENLLAIHRLQAFEATPAALLRLLASAERNLTDAKLPQPSNDNRFDAAYKTIMQCAMIGLWAKGFRTSSSQPGHHQTALQTLPKTLGISADTVIVLDALRKQRNQNDYEGEPVTDAALRECLTQAETLLSQTKAWLAERYPELLVEKR